MDDQEPWYDLPKLTVKMSQLGGVLSKLVELKRITDGSLGMKPPEAEQFFGKKSYFNAIGSHSAYINSQLKELDLKHLKPNSKNQIVQSSIYLQFKTKTRLKSCTLGLNFVRDFSPGGRK